MTINIRAPRWAPAQRYNKINVIITVSESRDKTLPRHQSGRREECLRNRYAGQLGAAGVLLEARGGTLHSCGGAAAVRAPPRRARPGLHAAGGTGGTENPEQERLHCSS